VKVVTAVANGDLRQPFKWNAKGEIAALGETLNNMTKTLSIFAQQVTSVARTVAWRASWGRRPRCPESPALEGPHRQRQTCSPTTDRAGTQHRGRDHLGRQGRSVAEDHRRRQGEVLELKNTINTMVDQLKPSPAR